MLDARAGQMFSLDDETVKLIESEMKTKSNVFLLNDLAALSDDEILLLYREQIPSGFLKVLSEPELVSSVLELFKNNLNVSETSRVSFLHRNTLLYRLDKVHRLTGLNVKSFEDAVTFKLMMVLFYEYRKRTNN